MQVQRIGYGIRGFYRVAHLGHLWEMTAKDAQRRLEILRFWDKHGLAATKDAFGVSRRSLYRWKAALRQAAGNPAALAAKPCTPKRKRTPQTDLRLIAEIRRLRELHPNLGKGKLHGLLAPGGKPKASRCPRPRPSGASLPAPRTRCATPRFALTAKGA